MKLLYYRVNRDPGRKRLTCNPPYKYKTKTKKGHIFSVTKGSGRKSPNSETAGKSTTFKEAPLIN
jgi:hypothetical protein